MSIEYTSLNFTARKDSGIGVCGCLTVFFAVLVMLPVLLLGVGWLLLPSLVSPSDPSWLMVEVDQERGEQVVERMENALVELDERQITTIEVTEEELNLLLAQALQAGEQETEEPYNQFDFRGRVRLLQDLIGLDLIVDIPEDADGVPRRLRGRPVGLALVMRPRAVDSGLAIKIEHARIGRIGLPVNTALSLLAAADEEIPFLDRNTGELRIPLAELSDEASPQTRIDSLEVADGQIRAVLSRLSDSP